MSFLRHYNNMEFYSYRRLLYTFHIIHTFISLTGTGWPTTVEELPGMTDITSDAKPVDTLTRT